MPTEAEPEAKKPARVAKATEWAIVKKGGDRGKRSTAAAGRTVGNLGLGTGCRAYAPGFGFAIRALEDVRPLLTHEGIAEAMTQVEKGVDLQAVSRGLRHPDASTVKALIKAWHVEWKVAPPLAYADEDASSLTPANKARLSLKHSDPLRTPLLVDSCGFNPVTRAPVVPAAWLGRRFESGEALQKELAGLDEGAPGAAAPKLAVYSLAVAPKDEWMDPTALSRSLSSQHVMPIAIMCITAQPKLVVTMDKLTVSRRGSEEVKMAALQAAIAKHGKPKTHLYRAVLGSEPESDVHRTGYLRPDKSGTKEKPAAAKEKSTKEQDDESASEDEADAALCYAATLILVVDRTLLGSRDDDDAAASNDRAQAAGPAGLLGTFADSTRRVSYPGSLLQKAIRRGTTLCGPEPILWSLNELAQKGTHHLPELQYQRVTGTRMALWKVFVSALEDVSPYFTKSGDDCFSLAQLVGLTFLSHAEPAFELPTEMKKRLAVTALRLQECERSSSLWPWKGWKWRKNTTLQQGLAIEGCEAGEIADVRNSIRVALLGLPVSRGERGILMKYLGGLDTKGVWAHAVPLLPGCRAEQALQAPFKLVGWKPGRDASVLNLDAELAAFDSSIKPTLLLLLQASLSKVPTDMMQHSLRSLAEAVWNLSSGVNVRSLKQKLTGAAKETYRFLSFVTDNPNATEAMTPEKLGIFMNGEGKQSETDSTAATWKTARDGQRLTKHEVLLLDTIQQLQRRMHAALHGTAPEQPAGTPAATASVAASAASGPVALRQRGRRPTPFEGRTAFLQLFGARVVVPAKTAEGGQVSCIVTVAGTQGKPLLVQRVSGADAGDQTGRAGLKDATLQKNAETAALKRLAKGVVVPSPTPPVGFVWQWDASAKKGVRREAKEITVRVTRHTVKSDVESSESSKADSDSDESDDDASDGDRTASSTGSSGGSGSGGGGDSDGDEGAYLKYFLGHTEIDPFDASALLVPCNEPSRTVALPPGMQELVPAALYTPGNVHPHPLEMFEELERLAEGFREAMGENDVFAWHHIAEESRLPRSVWRDMVIKVATREGDTVDVSRCARDGTKTSGALQQLTEGVLLRVLYTLQALYPSVLRRTGELRFRLTQTGAQYVHLQRMLGLLAFGSYDDGEHFHTRLARRVEGRGESGEEGGSDSDSDDSSGSDSDSDSLFSFEEESPARGRGVDAAAPSDMRVTTTLWSHQQEAVGRVLEGVALGKRGFADASAVGAGKTLSAVACCVRVAQWLAERKLRRHGFLVLVPNTDLVTEWIQQALLHTSGVHIVAQQQTGYLISRGVTNGGKPPKAHASTRRNAPGGKVDASTIVVSTLGRLRDKPFVSQVGWDMVIVDECLSVQNDTALQTVEAWRQVSASRCGVLMLSATFFRSRMSKLFYMIRMLRSALPRTEGYLPALLAEHIICYLPERTRSWKLQYTPVPLTADASSVYESRLSSAARSQKDSRLVYGELKTVIRDMWEGTDLVAAVDAECRRLQAQGRKVLIFANSERELAAVVKKCKGARTWRDGKASTKAGTGPLVVTTQRGAYGLNLQQEADAVICRPQAGDLIEQMKGRVDRPGQVAKELVLCIVYARDTVEEVEAANIRLCGAFFRQYLDPLSRLFQEKAVEASMSAREKHVQPRKGAMGGSGRAGPLDANAKVAGAVADAFRKDIAGDGAEVTEHGKEKAKADVPAAGTPPAKRARGADGDSPAAAGGQSGEAAKPRKLTKAEKEAEKKAKEEAAAAELKRAQEEEAALPKVPMRMTHQSAVKALEWLTERDPKLAAVIASVGPPTEMVNELGSDPALKSLVRSIVFQQISTKAASSILGRLSEVIGGEFTVERLQGADDASMRKAGLSSQKVSYVRNICEKFASGELSDDKLDVMSDADVLTALCSIKGMGEWSSHMFMMFKLGRHDVLPVGDLAVRQAFQKLYGLNPHDSNSETQVQYLPSAKEMHEIAKCWRPFRTIGTWYMWNVVETKEAAYTYGS